MNKEMDNIVRLENKEQILMDAALWLIKQEEGMSEAQQAEFKIWLNQSATHQKLYKQVAEPVQQADMLANLSEIFPYQPQQKKRRSRIAPKLAVALSAVLCFSLVILSHLEPQASYFNQVAHWWQQLIVQPQESVQQNPSLRFVKTYQTRYGEQATYSLPDESVLKLNTNSKVKVVYSQNRRDLYLDQGELHIQVAHDKSWPLSVIAKDKIIEAVGTAFNVSIESEQEVELIVTDGKVAVADSSDHDVSQAIEGEVTDIINLVKGEKLVLDTRHKVKTQLARAERISDKLDSVLSWQKGSLTYNGESLAFVVKELSRYTGYQFKLNQDELKQTKIVARIKLSDLENVFTVLEDNFGLVVDQSIDSNLILLSQTRSN